MRCWLHVVVIALLILVGFTLPEQSEEGGVPVMMGETPDAWGAADPSLVEVETMPEEAAPEMPEEAEQEMLTQEDEETVAIKPKAEEKKKEVKKPEKSAARKPKRRVSWLRKKRSVKRKAAEEAARKRVAGAFGKGAQMGSKVLRKEPVCREVLRETLRKGQLPGPADTGPLTLADAP